eukprot:TRINITY_DN2657_c0_g2_i1.p1 TRINITY_DN2657_c0_g2~~TRINITY_DN2657_c0_g2_i1.p1  ORF type:complete len:141 (-),score=39.00 TRINITY_DN2657_c0_g2_i1:295-717(-)
MCRFGSDHSPTMLKEVADAGNGIYYFIEKNDFIASAFADCFGGLLSTSAQSLILRIETLNGVSIQKLYSKFKTRVISEGTCYQLELGDLQAEEKRDIMIMVNLPSVSSSIHLFDIGLFLSLSLLLHPSPCVSLCLLVSSS